MPTTVFDHATKTATPKTPSVGELWPLAVLRSRPRPTTGRTPSSPRRRPRSVERKGALRELLGEDLDRVIPCRDHVWIRKSIVIDRIISARARSRENPPLLPVHEVRLESCAERSAAPRAAKVAFRHRTIRERRQCASGLRAQKHAQPL